MLSAVYMNYRESQIHYWEYENGVKLHKVAPAPLYFYMKDDAGGFKTIDGSKAKRVDFERYGAFKEKRDKLKELKVPLYESDVAIETKFIVDHYQGTELKIPQNFNIFFIDIEVHSEEGFPLPEDANGKITVITAWSTAKQKYFIFAEKKFDTTFLDKLNEKYEVFICKSEADLIRYFIRFVGREHPDMISGWNIVGFDIPYIVNRTKKILGEGCIEGISPVGVLREHEVLDRKTNMKRMEYSFAGINVIDMLDVYRNYTQSIKPSYALGAIALEEIGDTKNEYAGTLIDLYNNDWQSYMEYNLQDVRLLKKLDDKLGYMNLLISFCYGCKVPFEHYKKTTRVLDGAFISKLAGEGLVLPDVNRDNDGSDGYAGGFVADPEKGLQDWIISFDATSLYPSIMMNWNISPETKVAVIAGEEQTKWIYDYRKGDKSVETNQIDIAFKNKVKTASVKDINDLMIKNNLCLTANGVLYRQNEIGVIPRFVKEWFDKRKEYKKKMLAAKTKGNKDDEKFFNLLQMNYKILINSVYGYCGTIYSRFYDIDNAKAVTITGQTILKKTIDTLNSHFENKWETSKLGKSLNAKNFKNFVIYGDTDSVYVNSDRFLKSIEFKPSPLTDIQVDSFKKMMECDVVKEGENVKYITITKGKQTEVIHSENDASSIHYLIETFEPYVQDIIEVAMKELTKKMANCLDNKIWFKRESIARRGIFIEKKKYCMLVLNDEGNVAVDKLKVTGLDIVRSNTPTVAKKYLKKIVTDILKKVDRNHTVSQIREARSSFMTSSFEDIAFNVPCGNLNRYFEQYKQMGKFHRTPIQVRAGIIYNALLSERKSLQKKYDFIYEGDKTKLVYMKIGKDWTQDVISFKGKWVKEFNIDQYVDRNKQFEVSVINLMTKFFTLLEWELPRFNLKDLMSCFKAKV